MLCERIGQWPTLPQVTKIRGGPVFASHMSVVLTIFGIEAHRRMLKTGRDSGSKDSGNLRTFLMLSTSICLSFLWKFNGDSMVA